MSRTVGDFIGAGISFPLRLGPARTLALVAGRTEIEQSMWLILSTAPGERPMRPDFGCAIHDYVFAPANATTAGQLAHAVRVALERWEPRIDVEDVSVTVDEEDASKLYLIVTYVAKDSYDPRSLVFPFYVIPQEG